MTYLLLLALLGASPDFPDMDPGLVEDEPVDVVEPSGDTAPADDQESFPDVGPEEPEPAGVNPAWSQKEVKPRELTPAAPRRATPAPTAAAPAAARPVPVIQGATAVAAPKSVDEQAFIAGYADALWNDTRDSVQKRYPADRPLLDKGDGKWMITGQCEGEDANLVFAFDQAGALRSVVCQFKRGLENRTPDYPLYMKVREALVKRWGQPAATNESPAPDSPSQAAAWDGKSGKASLAYDTEAAVVQLTVERRP